MAIGLLLLVTGCVDEGSRPVSQEEFGYWWPLTVPRGKLACFRSESLEVIYFAAPDGKEYKLKGVAARSEKNLFPIQSILKRHPKNPRLYMEIHILIQHGERLCPLTENHYY